MSEEEKVQEPLKKVKWFAELVENLPKSKGEKGDNFVDRVSAIEGAKLVRAAGEVAMDAVTGGGQSRGIEKGISEGLADAGKKIITDKLTSQDPITSKVMATLGDVLAEDLKARLRGSPGQSDAEKELAAIKETKRFEEMFQKFTDEVVAPLAEQVQKLAAEKEEKPKDLTTDAAVDMVLEAQERAKKLLASQGYTVENVNVTKEQVKTMLTEEQAKFDELLKKEKTQWELETGAQVEIEKERVQATEKILTGVVDRVMDIFLEPIKGKIQEAIEKGALARK